MKILSPLFLGILGTFAFSWIGLTMIPNAQIGHLDPQISPDDEADIYPMPKSGMAARGRQIYVANGCVYCHSQQVRPDYAASDIDRKWGERRSAPRDYIFERPVLLGQMRTGPDLANIGHRAPADDANAPAPGSTNSATPGASPAPAATAASPAAAAPSPAPAASPAAAAPSPTAAQSPTVAAPTAEIAPSSTGSPLQYSAAWHHQHLYAPRTITKDSIMPSFRFLYEQRKISGERAADAIKMTGEAAPAEGWEVVPSYDAKCLVVYLMSLDQTHALKEVKSTAPPSPPAPGKAAK